MVERLKSEVIRNDGVFAVLMLDAVRCCSLGQSSNALSEVALHYRRNM